MKFLHKNDSEHITWNVSVRVTDIVAIEVQQRLDEGMDECAKRPLRTCGAVVCQLCGRQAACCLATYKKQACH